MIRNVALAAAGALGVWLLTDRASELVSGGIGRVEEVVAAVAAGAGALVAGWYGLTAAALLLLDLAALSRRSARAVPRLQGAVRLLGAPVLRRAATVSLGAGLALAAAPAGAAPSPAGGAPSPLLTSAAVTADEAREHAVPLDLRPGLSLSPEILEPPGSGPATAPRGGTDISEQSATPADAPATGGGTVRPRPEPSGRTSGDVAPEVPGTAVPAEELSAAATARSPAARPTAAAEADGEGQQTPEQNASPPPAGSGPAEGAQAPPTGAAPDQPARPARPVEPPPGDDPHVVRPGDSLWSIAAAHLGPAATDADITAAWLRWHSTNRAVIGADPDLIHPGQELLAPDRTDA